MIGRVGVIAVIAAWSGAAAQPAPAPPIIGRWDITVTTPKDRYPSWLEVRRSGNRMLVGQFVGRSGSARPISRIEFSSGIVRFSLPPQWESGDRDFHFEGKLEGDRLSGWMTDDGGAKYEWTASRAPLLRRQTPPEWGAPVALFNGRDLSGWEPIQGQNRWRAVNGVLSNAAAGANLKTRDTFTDFKLHAEFRYPPAGNSGIYLRGRYEVQIEDSGTGEPAPDHLGAIYGFLAPNQNASRGPNEWQTFDITLVGRLLTVILNGKTIISEQNIPGITGGALDSDEGAPGPLFLQGDHGPVEYRNLVLTPAPER
jgi:hypothetical protein